MRKDENRGVTSGNFLIGQLGPLERKLARGLCVAGDSGRFCCFSGLHALVYYSFENLVKR
jgi:hypothetical protein